MDQTCHSCTGCDSHCQRYGTSANRQQRCLDMASRIQHQRHDDRSNSPDVLDGVCLSASPLCLGRRQHRNGSKPALNYAPTPSWIRHVDSDPHTSLQLNCLMVGNNVRRIFPVQIVASQTVAALKKVIKEEKKHTLRDVDANALALWKVSIPVDDNSQENVGIPDGNPLSPVKKLSTVFLEPPVLEHIHIIVKGPAIAVGNRARIPKGDPFGIEVIDQRVVKELKSLRDVIEKFLKSPEPPTWVPPDYATQSNREFLSSLRIPSYRNGNPSLLLHDLHVCDGDEIKNIFEDAQHRWICNTSGSGKTRRMLEGLTKYWGFYLVPAPDVNNVGVRDLQFALDDVANYPDWIPDLRSLPSEERANQSGFNSHIASKHLKQVLAARIVVFKLFIELAIQVDGELQEKHKRIWLLFQLFDRIDPQVRAPHPFVLIMRCLRQASAQALDILIERFDDICALLPPSRFIVGLDDAQPAVRLYRYSFISSTDNDVLRSVLREIIQVFTKPPIKLVVSGTGLSLGDLEDSMVFGVSKPVGYELFHKLGMFDTGPKLKKFLERYVPASFWETLSGYCLQQRMREYLLGRYRFSVSFLEYLLRNGLESPHKLLNEYIKGHAACFPGDSGFAFTSNEPELHISVSLGGFDWARLEDDPTALQEAAQIVQSHITRGSSPRFGPVTTRLVEYGIARLHDKHEGQIVEPLAFLSLMKWLESQSTVNLQTNIRLRLANQDLRYEQLVVLYLLRVLRYPVPFSTIFQFHGTPPRWADEMAQIGGRLDGIALDVDVLGKSPENPGLGMVHYADGIEDVLDWIENRTTMPAVLVPNKLFGPDVMVWCGDVLLMGQLKSYTKGNKESPDTNALTSLCPDLWFKQSPSHLRQKLLHAIKQHRVLCFVGDPLPSNLDLGGNSVSNALTVLGPDVVLATIYLDTFRAHFVAEDQARDVVGLMEHGLARKRKADEIDNGT